jgi:hypothetical protein
MARTGAAVELRDVNEMIRLMLEDIKKTMRAIELKLQA